MPSLYEHFEWLAKQMSEGAGDGELQRHRELLTSPEALAAAIGRSEARIDLLSSLSTA